VYHALTFFTIFAFYLQLFNILEPYCTFQEAIFTPLRVGLDFLGVCQCDWAIGHEVRVLRFGV